MQSCKGKPIAEVIFYSSISSKFLFILFIYLVISKFNEKTVISYRENTLSLIKIRKNYSLKYTHLMKWRKREKIKIKKGESNKTVFIY